jgi:hypothetical protein
MEITGFFKKENLKKQMTPIAVGFDEMPELLENERLICEFHQSYNCGVRIFTCNTIEEIQGMFRGLGWGLADEIKWFKGPDPSTVSSF